jgi:glycosyltransferase involved in cell wall biosynthesis
VTDAGGTREVTGDAAVLVPVGDAAAFAEALTGVLGDDARRAALREAARARAATLPGIADVLTQLDAAYAR